MCPAGPSKGNSSWTVRDSSLDMDETGQTLSHPPGTHPPTPDVLVPPAGETWTDSFLVKEAVRKRTDTGGSRRHGKRLGSGAFPTEFPRKSVPGMGDGSDRTTAQGSWTEDGRKTRRSRSLLLPESLKPRRVWHCGRGRRRHVRTLRYLGLKNMLDDVEGFPHLGGRLLLESFPHTGASRLPPPTSRHTVLTRTGTDPERRGRVDSRLAG